MKLLTKGNLFGEVQCFMYSVEWQKCDLPHMHIFLWLKQRISPDKLDCIISAEIPDPQKDSLLYNIIKVNMIHGPIQTIDHTVWIQVAVARSIIDFSFKKHRRETTGIQSIGDELQKMVVLLLK